MGPECSGEGHRARGQVSPERLLSAELLPDCGAGADSSLGGARGAHRARAQGLRLSQDCWRQLRQHLLVRSHEHLLAHLRREAGQRGRQIEFGRPA